MPYLQKLQDHGKPPHTAQTWREVREWFLDNLAEATKYYEHPPIYLAIVSPDVAHDLKTIAYATLSNNTLDPRFEEDTGAEYFETPYCRLYMQVNPSKGKRYLGVKHYG